MLGWSMTLRRDLRRFRESVGDDERWRLPIGADSTMQTLQPSQGRSRHRGLMPCWFRDLTTIDRKSGPQAPEWRVTRDPARDMTVRFEARDALRRRIWSAACLATLGLGQQALRGTGPGPDHPDSSHHGRDDLFDRVEDPVNLVVSHDIRRHEVDDIPIRTQEKAAAQEFLREPWPDP